MSRCATGLAIVLVSALAPSALAAPPSQQGGDKGIHNLMQDYHARSAQAQGTIYTAIAARNQLAAANPAHPDLPAINALIAGAAMAVKDNSVPAGFPVPAGFNPAWQGLFEIAFYIYMDTFKSPREVAVLALKTLIGRCKSADHDAHRAIKAIKMAAK